MIPKLHRCIIPLLLVLHRSITRLFLTLALLTLALPHFATAQTPAWRPRWSS